MRSRAAADRAAPSVSALRSGFLRQSPASSYTRGRPPTPDPALLSACGRRVRTSPSKRQETINCLHLIIDEKEKKQHSACVRRLICPCRRPPPTRGGSASRLQYRYPTLCWAPPVFPAPFSACVGTARAQPAWSPAGPCKGAPARPMGDVTDDRGGFDQLIWRPARPTGHPVDSQEWVLSD